MKKLLTKITYIIIILSIPPVFGCNSEDEPKTTSGKMKVFEKLTGTWIRETRTGKGYEIWQKMNDSLYYGEGWLVKGNDSTLIESIRLFGSGEDIYYAPTVPDQNDSMEILFKLVQIENEIIFENPEHDFPNRIRYSFPQKDELRVVVEDNESSKRQFFNFYKGK